MKLNADFAARVAVHWADAEWAPSPTKGVDRRMLDRIGEEIARATSFVRFAPGSRFPSHVHGGGEEFLVLEGEFEDEHGSYPPGSYLRNPPGSEHAPGSGPGCLLFVKLWQFERRDRTDLRLRPGSIEFRTEEKQPGVETACLHRDGTETVCLERWPADGVIEREAPAGLEMLVLDGRVEEGGETFIRHDWLRLPARSRLSARAGPSGATIWTKVGHLDPPLGLDPVSARRPEPPSQSLATGASLP